MGKLSDRQEMAQMIIKSWVEGGMTLKAAKALFKEMSP